MRLDKWLWAARFFKTRAVASRACDIGRIQSNGQRAKPAREVRAGDKLRIENERGIFEIEVLLVSAVRGPAAVAQTLYSESDASREARLHLAAERKAMEQYVRLPEGRPLKARPAAHHSIPRAWLAPARFGQLLFASRIGNCKFTLHAAIVLAPLKPVLMAAECDGYFMDLASAKPPILSWRKWARMPGRRLLRHHASQPNIQPKKAMTMAPDAPW